MKLFDVELKAQDELVDHGQSDVPIADKGQGFGKGTGPNLSGKEVDVNPFTKTGQEQSKEDKYDKFSKLKV